jgi:hypothetical protein
MSFICKFYIIIVLKTLCEWQKSYRYINISFKSNISYESNSPHLEFSNLNLPKSSYHLTKLDPSNSQETHFTFDINGEEERWEILIAVTIVSQWVENCE